MREYVSFHPASRELRGLEHTLATLAAGRGRAGGAGGRPPGLAAPPPPALPTPPGLTGEEAPAAVDLTRARAEVRDDFELRRLAEPFPEPEREPAPSAPLPAAEAVPPSAPRPAPARPERGTGLETALRRLQEQLDALQERPQDRLFYSPVQLRRRRELYRVTQVELAELRRKQVQAIGEALAAARPIPAPVPETPRARPPRRVPVKQPPLPNPRLEQAEAAALEALEREAVLPTPPPVDDALLPDEELAEGREQITGAVRRAERRGQALPVSAGPPAGALSALQRRRAELSRLILDDLRTASVAAGKARGWTVNFRRADAPNRTAELRASVRALLAGRGEMKR